ncbi:hypothetical protein [Reinekea marinisedimentorum]|uniref:Uncharacterized protein n=1 Tax=Reinekea marinisedimentorum TaxID=230495 RepID=A0A4R3HZG7_9GAMM|nr:hypothetical protein [Reinekea marinisedimentorum]TCS38776.1 hypothetical protein BCF53_11550 [Reinekea marinisedimentorum]
MVDSISSTMMMPMLSSSNSRSSDTASSLSDEQTTTLTDILSSFDSEALTEADAQEIVTALSEAGIEPGAGLEEAMSEAGFDARAVGDMAGVGETGALAASEGAEEGSRPPPPPPQSSSTESDDVASYMADLISETLSTSESSELTQEEMQEIQALVAEEFGLEEGDSMIDITV